MTDQQTTPAYEVVQGTFKLFARGGTWIQGEFARNFIGWTVKPESWWACQWCLLGGLEHVAYKLYPENHVHIANTAKTLVYNASLDFGVGGSSWNDDPERTVQDILAALGRVTPQTRPSSFVPL